MIRYHLIAFASMFLLIFVGLIAVIAFVPFLMVFIAWDMSVLNINWDFVFVMLRLNVLVSTFIGMLFAFSKEGKAMAKEMFESKTKV